MLVQEFINRCGYQPTAEEWEQITWAYMAHSGDKDEFCREWSRLNPGKAGSLKRAEKRDKELQKKE